MKTKMKTACYISGTGTRLRKIIESASDNIVSGIQFVISDASNDEMANFLKHYPIDYIEVDISRLESGKERSSYFSQMLLSECELRDIDYVFVFGNTILTGELLKKYENRLINFHPSLLPNYKGFNPIDKALERGECLLGNTVHFINEEIDKGPIIMQNVVSAKIFDLYSWEGVLDGQVELFMKLYSLLEADRIHVQGANVVITGANYSYSCIFPYTE